MLRLSSQARPNYREDHLAPADRIKQPRPEPASLTKEQCIQEHLVEADSLREKRHDHCCGERLVRAPVTDEDRRGCRGHTPRWQLGGACTAGSLMATALLMFPARRGTATRTALISRSPAAWSSPASPSRRTSGHFCQLDVSRRAPARRRRRSPRRQTRLIRPGRRTCTSSADGDGHRARLLASHDVQDQRTNQRHPGAARGQGPGQAQRRAGRSIRAR